MNFYEVTAKLGMHQDKDKRSDAPVVSLSLGDTCSFRFGNTADRGKPYTDIDLVSGDLFVFGGPSRFAYHRVPRGYPAIADPRIGLTGRLNITTRVTGLLESPVHARRAAADVHGSGRLVPPDHRAGRVRPEEAGFYLKTITEASERPPQTLLELGSGAGNNAFHYKREL